MALLLAAEEVVRPPVDRVVPPELAYARRIAAKMCAKGRGLLTRPQLQALVDALGIVGTWIDVPSLADHWRIAKRAHKDESATGPFEHYDSEGRYARVRQLLADLEAAGYIEWSKVSRMVRLRGGHGESMRP